MICQKHAAQIEYHLRYCSEGTTKFQPLLDDSLNQNRQTGWWWNTGPVCVPAPITHMSFLPGRIISKVKCFSLKKCQCYDQKLLAPFWESKTRARVLPPGCCLNKTNSYWWEWILWSIIFIVFELWRWLWFPVLTLILLLRKISAWTSISHFCMTPCSMQVVQLRLLLYILPVWCHGRNISHFLFDVQLRIVGKVVGKIV